jgi:hypothetical protein
MFIVQPEANLQCRLLFDGPSHPQGLSRRSLVGGEVSPAKGTVPTTAMVTAAVADGASTSSSGLARVEEVEGLHEDM